LDPHQDAAIWAPFGLINESLGAEKFLLARREYKCFAAIAASEIFIRKFHIRETLTAPGISIYNPLSRALYSGLFCLLTTAD
jgi:hypothetical protein